MKPADLSFRSLTLIALGLLALPALAQGVYRIVGPDGRVTFSDQPPADAPSRSGTGTSSAASTGGTLPFELRQVASRYPVTLYTGKDCAPCNSGRNLLSARGIPFAEKTVSTAEDGEALRRLNGDGSLPLLSIGSQQIKGYSDIEWTQYLDAAGYPKQSQLPSGYRRPAPAPLVAVKPAAAAPKAKEASGPAPAAAVPVAPPATNPAGIRF